MLTHLLPILLLAGLAAGTFHPDETPTVQRAVLAQPPLGGEECKCLEVRCVGSNEFEVVRGCGATEAEAQAAAEAAAVDHCGTGNVAETRTPTGPVPGCGPEDEASEGSGIVQIKAESDTEELIKVRGRLRYHDGTYGIRIVTTGSTYAEAKERAFSYLRARREPCKAVTYSFAIAEENTNPACVCGPRNP